MSRNRKVVYVLSIYATADSDGVALHVYANRLAAYAAGREMVAARRIHDFNVACLTFKGDPASISHHTPGPIPAGPSNGYGDEFGD